MNRRPTSRHRRACIAVGSVVAAFAASGCGSDAPGEPSVADASTPAVDGGVDAHDASRPSDAGSPADAPATPDADAAPQTITTPNESAGQRLRPTYERFTFADGAEWRLFAGLRDTMRDEPCYEQTLSDGQVHCAPQSDRAYLVPDQYFADATCTTTPVLGFLNQGGSNACRATPTPGKTRYFQLPSPLRCAPARLIEYPKTAPLAVTTVYLKSAGTCTAVPLTAQPGEAWEVYASPPLPLSEVPPSSFVTLSPSIQLRASSSRLRAFDRVVLGDDGSKSSASSRDLFELVDSQRNEFCHPIVGGDGSARCMPWGEWVADSGYSDPGCSQPAFLVDSINDCNTDSRDTTSSYLMQRVGACGLSLVPRFTSNPLATVYGGKPSACTGTPVSTTSPDYLYYAGPLPAAIPSSAFAEYSSSLTDAPEWVYGKSGSRIHLKANTLTSADGLAVSNAAPFPWDGTQGAGCYPEELDDGSLHCVPSTYAYFDYDGQRGNYFADAACSDPVFGVDTTRLACTPNVTMFAESPTTINGCRALRLWHVPASPIANPKLFALTNGTCSPTTVDTTVYAFYRKADSQQVQASTFVTASSSIIE